MKPDIVNNLTETPLHKVGIVVFIISNIVKYSVVELIWKKCPSVFCGNNFGPPPWIFFQQQQKLTKTKVSGFFARGRSVEVAASLLQNGANVNARSLIH